MRVIDVRVGNLVDLYGTIATIQREDFAGKGIAIDKGSPIELTEEWLRDKFDLPKRKKGIYTTHFEYSIRNTFEIFCHIDGAKNCLFYGEHPSGEDFFIRKCNTVHDFQNIYAVLNTHEKLTIKK